MLHLTVLILSVRIYSNCYIMGGLFY